MIFLDYSLLCSSPSTASLTPTHIDPINKLLIKNAWFDDLYATKNVSDTYIYDGTGIPKFWDFDTILHAEYDDVLYAGNVSFLLESVTGILIKRRKEGDFKWITILYKPVHTFDDFEVFFQDRTCALGTTYDYAFVPLISSIETNYSKTTVTTDNSKVVIADQDDVWGTVITDGALDVTRNYPSSAVTTLYDRYPTIVRNTAANYETVTCTATWLPSEEGKECEIIDINDKKKVGLITKYAYDFMEFLTNNNTKLLKAPDGRIWLCFVNDGLTNNATDDYLNREITFSVTEIANALNEEDLCDAGFIDENTEPWWND